MPRITGQAKLLAAIAGFGVSYLLYRKRWSIAHNCAAHPLKVLFEDSPWLDRFHDWTGRKWGGENER
jgi:hypothetical protein